MKLVVVEVDGLLVVFEEVEDLVEFEEEVEEALELSLTLLADIHLHHLLLLEVDGLEDDEFFVSRHEYSVEAEEEDGEDGEEFDLDVADLIAVEMLIHLVLQPHNDSLLFAPHALLQLLPALQVNYHHPYLLHLPIVHLPIQLSQLTLTLLQLILLDISNHLSLHHQDAPCSKLELIVTPHVELRL